MIKVPGLPQSCPSQPAVHCRFPRPLGFVTTPSEPCSNHPADSTACRRLPKATPPSSSAPRGHRQPCKFPSRRPNLVLPVGDPHKITDPICPSSCRHAPPCRPTASRPPANHASSHLAVQTLFFQPAFPTKSRLAVPARNSHRPIWQGFPRSGVPTSVQAAAHAPAPPASSAPRGHRQPCKFPSRRPDPVFPAGVPHKITASRPSPQ